MDENRPLPPPAPDDPAGPPELPEEDGLWARPGRGRFWRNVRWLISRGVALLGAFVLMGAALTGLAGWYTSRPEFCRSCHIMEPYYVSWHESSHKDVSCVKCHFPPGAGEKIRGKMLGLVQLAKYVTGSAGPRPAAEIPDASCLRSGCHETRLLSGRIDFDGIPFDHRPHLEELRRGKQLRCTSCHSQIVQGSHMTVTKSTCYLCHFKDTPFNEGLGACNRCHQIPEKDFELGGGTKFNHNLAYEKGVDCTNCHGDLIRGKGEVPRERCGVCHNRESDLQRKDDHVFMHQMHVTDHKVDCLACHMEIQHSLDAQRIEHAASNCAACHPGHHGEQVKMLAGTGGKTFQPNVNGMSVIRIACPSCHKFKEVSATGTVLWKASTESCLTCHERGRIDSLTAYHTALRGSLEGLDAALTRVREALPGAELNADRALAINSQLDDIQYDLTFLRVGNGVHNIHYASTLTRAVMDRLTALCRELKVPEPEVTLPEVAKPETEKTEAAKPEPAEPEPAEPEPAKPDAEPAKEEMAEPEPAEPEPAKPDAEPAKPEAEPAKPDPPEPPEPPDPAKPTEPEPADPEPAKPAEAQPEAAPQPVEPKAAASES